MRIAAALLALLLACTAWPAVAADYGGVVPGTTTLESVRTLFGPPTRATSNKVDNYEVTQWLYEGQRAPAGMKRMIIDFGLLASGAFRRDVVRALTLEPKPGIFDVDLVLQGWGIPHRESPPGQPIAFLYETGLLVNFADDGRTVLSMVFTPPQVKK